MGMLAKGTEVMKEVMGRFGIKEGDVEGQMVVVGPDDILVKAWRCSGEMAVEFLTGFSRIRVMYRAVVTTEV